MKTKLIVTVDHKEDTTRERLVELVSFMLEAALTECANAPSDWDGPDAECAEVIDGFEVAL